MTGQSHEDVEAVALRLLLQAKSLVGESHALGYALVMVLASTPRQQFTRDEIDALCQVAYELLDKLARAIECFEEIDRSLDA